MKKTLLVLLIILTTGNLRDIHAEPAWPGLLEYRQPDGSMLHVRLYGDERFCYYMSEDGLPLFRAADGFFCYAEISSEGLRATDIMAHYDGHRYSLAEQSFVAKFDRTAFATAIQSLKTKAAEKSIIAPMHRKSPAVRRNAPLPHSQKTLAILVEFPQLSPDDKDINFSLPNPKELFSNMLNAENFSYDGATGSVSDYFKA